MAGRLSYAHEKFSSALYSFARATPLQRRLQSAHSSFVTIVAEDFDDPDLKARYQSIMDRLTADRSNPDKGYIPTTLASMSDDDAEAVARDIVELSNMIGHSLLWAAEDALRKAKR